MMGNAERGRERRMRKKEGGEGGRERSVHGWMRMRGMRRRLDKRKGRRLC